MAFTSQEFLFHVLGNLQRGRSQLGNLPDSSTSECAAEALQPT